MQNLIQSTALVGAGLCLGMVGTIGAIGQPDLHQPALIGFNCQGAGGPLYADSEDYFPQCMAIERTAAVFENEAAAAGHDNWGEWQLVAIHNGNTSIIDYNLSGDDCDALASLMLANEGKPRFASFDVLYCEDMGASQ